MMTAVVTAMVSAMTALVTAMVTAMVTAVVTAMVTMTGERGHGKQHGSRYRANKRELPKHGVSPWFIPDDNVTGATPVPLTNDNETIPDTMDRSEDTCGFKVVDANGQSLAYVYGRADARDAGIAKALTLDEARRIAANIAKLPSLLAKGRS